MEDLTDDVRGLPQIIKTTKNILKQQNKGGFSKTWQPLVKTSINRITNNIITA